MAKAPVVKESAPKIKAPKRSKKKESVPESEADKAACMAAGVEQKEVSVTESENSKQSELAQAPSDASMAQGSSSKEIIHRRPVKKYVE